MQSLYTILLRFSIYALSLVLQYRVVKYTTTVYMILIIIVLHEKTNKFLKY